MFDKTLETRKTPNRSIMRIYKQTPRWTDSRRDALYLQDGRLNTPWSDGQKTHDALDNRRSPHF